MKVAFLYLDKPRNGLFLFLYLEGVGALHIYIIYDIRSTYVACNTAKMREAIMEDQDEFLMRNSEHTDVSVETNNRAQLEDVGQNADLYIANQEANTNTQP